MYDVYFRSEVSKLKEMFYLNGYPKSSFDKALKRFLDKQNSDVLPTNDENTYIMKGRDIRTGVPKEVTLTEKDTAEAMSPVINQMIQALKDALENTPPELAADLVDMGCVLAGGGAYLKNFDKLISKETGLPVSIAEDPLSCVALGTGKSLEKQCIFSTMLTE